jgi:hypothetical protein
MGFEPILILFCTQRNVMASNSALSKLWNNVSNSHQTSNVEIVLQAGIRWHPAWYKMAPSLA